MKFGKLKYLVIAAVATTFMGCAAGVSPVNGGWYTNVHGPMTATTNTAGAKSGKACATSILGLIATGDASIDEAKKAGGITKVTNVDYHTTSVLGLFAEFCTIAHGE